LANLRLAEPARQVNRYARCMASNPPQRTVPAGDVGDWLAPHVSGPVRARVELPGSKSMTNRALVLAALADGQTEIIRPLAARDTALMAGGLRGLGCLISESDGCWLVSPLPARPADRTERREAQIDVGNAGTVLRFLPPVAAMTGMDVRFSGDERVAERPIGPMLRALVALGAQISDGGTGTVPFVVHGQGAVRGGEVTLDASSSSQFISGLLLAAPRFGDGLVVRHQGPPVPSAPHIEMTVRMLRTCGVDVRTGDETNGEAGAAGPAASRGGAVAERAIGDVWRVFPGLIAAQQIFIEPDLSNAVPFLAAALATGGEVTVADWPADSLQPAARIIDVLTAMGADVARTPAGLRVSGSGRISGIGADLSAVGELTPVLTALAALADAPCEFTGIGHLRRHETDRLAALAGEIGKLGGDVTELADGLRIRPRPLRADGVVFDSHDDHRLVMAAAVLGLVTKGLRVHNAATVGKTFPGFSTYWADALAPAG
jgi:3-phosphoshikimate 1-carboxyvinyltransferase